MTYKMIDVQKDLKDAGYDVLPADPSTFNRPGIVAARSDRQITDDEASMIAQRFSAAMRDDLCDVVHDESRLSLERLRAMALDRSVGLRERSIAVSYVAGFAHDITRAMAVPETDNCAVSVDFMIFVGELSLIITELGREMSSELSAKEEVALGGEDA